MHQAGYLHLNTGQAVLADPIAWLLSETNWLVTFGPDTNSHQIICPAAIEPLENSITAGLTVTGKSPVVATPALTVANRQDAESRR